MKQAWYIRHQIFIEIQITFNIGKLAYIFFLLPKGFLDPCTIGIDLIRDVLTKNRAKNRKLRAQHSEAQRGGMCIN